MSFETESNNCEESVEKERDEATAIYHISLKDVKRWRADLKKEVSIKTVRLIIRSFCECVKSSSSSKCVRIDSNATMNELIILCLEDNLSSYLEGLKKNKQKWRLNERYIRVFLMSLIELSVVLSQSSHSNVETTVFLLRRIKKCSSLFACFPKLQKKLINHLCEQWSDSSNPINSLRLSSFFCLHQMVVRSERQEQKEDPNIEDESQTSILHDVLKKMYAAYSNNTMFVNKDTLASIRFMQKCMSQMCNVNANSAYPICFIFMRDIATKLRQAIRSPKLKTHEITSSSFLKSIELWTFVICELHSKSDTLKSLTSPLVQIISETIRLVCSARYYPFRFQCIENLIELCRHTGLYIPVLRFLNDSLVAIDLNKHTKTKNQLKQDFDVNFKLSKEEMDDTSFQDEIVNRIYDLTVQFCSIYACHIAFPEMTMAFSKDLKKIVKVCERDHHRKKLKTLSELLCENIDFIEQRRMSSGTIDLKDDAAVEQWIRRCKIEGSSPLGKFYEQYSQLKNDSKRSIMEDNEESCATKRAVKKKKVIPTEL